MTEHTLTKIQRRLVCRYYRHLRRKQHSRGEARRRALHFAGTISKGKS